MLPSDLRAYRARWEAVAQIERDERRSATVLTRWNQLNAIFRLAEGLNLLRKPADKDYPINQRWGQLRHLFDVAE